MSGTGPAPGEAAVADVLEDLVRIDRDVGDHISALIDLQMAQWLDRGGDPSVAQVLSSYRAAALVGGKRLRPALARWAFEGAGGDPDDPAILDVAAAVELLHTFALIHDDVMDQADTRRGVETIHVAYRERHRADGLRGESGRYGESIAILVGDLAFAHAALLMSRVPTECARIFFEVCAELMVGQYLDIDSSARGPMAGNEVADQITELKTARYSVEAPLTLGVALAGRAAEMAPHVHAYGNPVGHAFQLRDDLLGAFGDPVTTGKPVGADLAQGKVTRLLELGLARTSGDDRALLERLGSPSMHAGDVERAAGLLVDCGARAVVEADIERLVVRATDAIRRSPLLPAIQDRLIGAALLVAHRNH